MLDNIKLMARNTAALENWDPEPFWSLNLKLVFCENLMKQDDDVFTVFQISIMLTQSHLR